MDATLLDPLVGRVLDDRYAVQARIARGGMATVYTALDTRLDRLVAVKVLHAAYAADPDFVGRFRREAKAAARLSHPGVVGVYDQGSDGDLLFLVMEYVRGRTLRDLLRERGRLSAGAALEVMEPVLTALAAAHAAGLVHRDVKPENVLLADDGRIKVADFGLARAVEATTATASMGLLLGTVHYLAPEQVATGASDARTDVYAAGVVLYELLTGSPPYDGDTVMSVAFRHVHEDVPPPSRMLPGLPEPLDDLVGRATAREPDARFADALEFLGALRRTRAVVPPDPLPGIGGDRLTVPVRARGAARQATIVAPLPAPAPALPADAEARRGSRRLRRHPRRRRLLVTLLVLLAALAGLAGWWGAVGRYATVPAVLGLPKADAVHRVDSAGLHVRWLPDRFDSTIGAGRVALEQPARGGHVQRGATVTLALSKGPEVHRLDQLAGRPLAAAQAVVTGYGLRATVTEVYDDKVRAGTLLRTNPPAGTLLRPGDAVTLFVSKGPQPVTVPDVSGQPLADAQAALGAVGLRVTVRSAYSDVVDSGRVISQVPPRGLAPHGSAVALTVSKGPQLFAVPDVRGDSVDKARRVLEGAGFSVRVYAPFGFGRVHAQSPAAGSLRPHDTTVTIIAY